MGAVFFIPYLGSVHLFDWDEINFAESAREMLVTGNYWQVQINFEPFWEKPPLFFWMQTFCMHLFGVTEFAARLPNAMCGIVTLCVLFSIGKSTRNENLGWIWALLYAGSLLPHLYFRSGIIDPWFNLFIFLSVWFLFRTVQENSAKQAVFSGIFTGLAILTKGPVGFLLLFLTFLVWWILNRFRKPVKWGAILAYAVSAALVTSIWFARETIVNGPWFIGEFIAYQIDLFLRPVAGHKQPFFYHFVVVLLGCFPISVIALPRLFRNSPGMPDFSIWARYLFWVVLILFSIVTTKIVHYSSMTYLPLSYLAALHVTGLMEKRKILARWQRIWLTVQGCLLGFLLFALPLAVLFKEKWVGFIKDDFAVGNLRVDVHWQGWEWSIGLAFIAFVLAGTAMLGKGRTWRGVLLFSLGISLCLWLYLPAVVQKIEGHTQRTAIEFFETHRGKQHYISTFKYKTYAHYFYARVHPEVGPYVVPFEELDLLHDQKEVYVVSKNTRAPELLESGKFELLYEKGGFSFFRRKG